jgi:hypothetical protein
MKSPAGMAWRAGRSVLPLRESEFSQICEGFVQKTGGFVASGPPVLYMTKT